MPRAFRNWPLLLLGIATVGSSPAAPDTPPLTPSEASTLVRGSQVFRRPKTVEILAGGRMPTNITRVHYLVLRNLALIQFTIEGAVAEVHLTAAGRLAAQSWKRSYTGSYGSSDLWHLSIAERALLEVLSIHHVRDDGAVCDFAWKWVPDKIGRALQLSEAVHKATAHFTRGARGWRPLEEGPEGLRVCLEESKWSQ
ncbi:MAG: hypothetical protein HY236_12900 [Acidobacteria bacterium]|nr:hypothetical protein [Acidobacteriota bacterium]